MTRLNGGCACGSVRYSLADPYDTGWCHCRLCQRTSGAPAVVFTTTRHDSVRWERGEPRHWRSTDFGRRAFCAECGTLLTIEVDFQPGEIGFTAASLDDPEAVRPAFHIFCGEELSWAAIEDGLPRHAKYRPETLGLPPDAVVAE